MDLRIYPTKLRGTIGAIASKSMAHRMLICGALADRETSIVCQTVSKDIIATAQCLSEMGAPVRREKNGFHVSPVHPGNYPKLPCGESGSTLRFLLPVIAALGHGGTFHMEGRLPKRPLTALAQELEAHGIKLSRPDENTLSVSGQLTPGCYRLPGNVSSQYISGLLFALPLLCEESVILLDGVLESAPYVAMTIGVLRDFGVLVRQEGHSYHITPSIYRSPEKLTVEGDWSNGAFWLTAAAIGNLVSVTGLDECSLQGDRAIISCLSALGGGKDIDVSDIPDLVPILAVAACIHEGQTHFVNAGRLRMKESDRIHSVVKMLSSLGCSASESVDSLTVMGSKISGGVVDSANDHRIAMSAAIAATVSHAPVTVLGAEAVSKSYPDFWKDYAALGGQFEEI